MAEHEPHLARLLALDIDAKRSRRIADNLTRLKLEAEVLVGDAANPKLWWDGASFDRILLDAPCSALGVIRRHPDIRVRKTLKDLEKLPGVQKQLLRAAWGMLAQGGRLVYATCTITRSENRDVIGSFLENAHDAEIVPVESWSGWPGLGEVDEFGCQILPGEAGADGFYYAVLTKR
jgi:16S rRNA (cytosine967-C5)-methyltransferase